MFRFGRIVTYVSCAICVTVAAHGAITMPTIFGDHMVLQQKQTIPVWGTADPNEAITVTLGEHSVTATADAAGKWRADLPAVKAGGTHTLVVKGAAEEKQFADVLVGEVWLLGGQSNTEWSVKNSMNAEQEVAAANYPEIRLFMAEHVQSAELKDDVPGTWQVCTPETVADFSAIGYFFGRIIHEELDVPVGLIKSAWGGTPAESWTTTETLTSTPELAPLMERWNTILAEFPQKQTEFEQAQKDWEAAGKPEGQQPRAPMGPDHPHRPASLYNGMIAPIKPYGIRGSLWYQGESNVGRADEYAVLFPKMIEDWRRVWGQGDFPFYFVQLANFLERAPEPTPGSEWAALRDAQLAALKLPNTGVALAIDIGEAADIHPKNKQDVGKRLALNALNQVYGRQKVYKGPSFKSAKVQDGKVTITLADAKGLKTSDGGPVKGFALAGADGVFVWANAEISAKKVIVTAPGVAAPTQVLYAWQDNPEVNLYNGADLPAVPFRATLGQ